MQRANNCLKGEQELVFAPSVAPLLRLAKRSLVALIHDNGGGRLCAVSNGIKRTLMNVYIIIRCWHERMNRVSIEIL